MRPSFSVVPAGFGFEFFHQSWTNCRRWLVGLLVGWTLTAVAQIPNPAAVQVASGALRVLRFEIDPVRTHGLPVNEVEQSELDKNNPSLTGFVPSQLGNFLAVSALGNAWRNRDANFTAGYTDRELVTTWAATMTAIENILATNAYIDPVTGKKSFYQYHQNDGTVDDDDFSRIVSMLDCDQAIVGMHVAEQYLRVRTHADLAPDVSLAEVRALADRFTAALTNFDYRMWLETNPTNENFGLLYFGDTRDAHTGVAASRLMNEGRLGYVAALARNELSQGEFQYAINQIRVATPKGQGSYGGPWVERRAYFGTGLEIYAITPFITPEQRGPFGEGSLYPYVDAWLATANYLQVPAAGATAIATGFSFATFGMSPCENSAAGDEPLIIPPATGMMAGATGVAPFNFLQPMGERALSNLTVMVSYLQTNGGWDTNYGAANYRDVSSGLVDDTDRIYGTLEIEEMSLGLLNGFLGGRYLEDLLRHDGGWFNAYRQYQAALNTREVEFNSSAADSYRGGASASRSVRLENNGDTTTNTFLIGEPGTYSLAVHYSNDGISGTPEVVEVFVDGISLGQFTTQDSGNWSTFIPSPWLSLGTVSTPRVVTVSFKLVSGSYHGIELDDYVIQRSSLGVNDPAAVTKPNAGQGIVPFTISLISPFTNTVTVQFATADDTAVAGTDYIATNGLLTFNPGETVKQILVAINGNTNSAADKVFHLQLNNPNGAGLDRARGTATILGDLTSVSSPSLTITADAGQIVLSWPSATAGYQLQTTTDLANPSWDAVSNGIVSSGGNNYYTNSSDDTARYFRLLKP